MSNVTGASTVIQEWVTGRRKVFERIIFAESASGAAAVAPRLTARDALIAPAESNLEDVRGTLVRYTGALRQFGDEMRVGDHGIELLDYVAVDFVDVLGPTVVRLTDEMGWTAFLEDADRARHTGVFSAGSRDPRLLLADREVFASPYRCEPPATLHVRADGGVSLGAQGIELGGVDGLEAAFEGRHPRLAGLGGVVPWEQLTTDVRARPWLGRYLLAGDLLRILAHDAGSAAVSGFGCRVVDDVLADAEPMRDDPLMILSGDDVLLADLTTLRRQRLAPRTAQIVEIVQTSSNLRLATQRVASRIGVPESSARTLCIQAMDELGVHLGQLADDVSATALPVVCG